MVGAYYGRIIIMPGLKGLSGYPKQKIFAFKVCANIVVTLSVVTLLLPVNFKWL